MKNIIEELRILFIGVFLAVVLGLVVWLIGGHAALFVILLYAFLAFNTLSK